MQFVKLLMIVIVLSLSAGCYEMKQDDKGRTLKVNKITGDISVIEGDKIIKLKGEKEVKAEQDAAEKLGDAIKWPEVSLTIANGANAKLVTKWNAGIMYYQLFIDKNLRGKGDVLAMVSIQLHDNASFLIKEIPVSVLSMTGSLGIDGKTIESMEFKGERPMAEETYKKISGWNVTWAGFN